MKCYISITVEIKKKLRQIVAYDNEKGIIMLPENKLLPRDEI